MNRASKLALVLCLVAAASWAQISVRDRSLVPLEADCPIGIRATLEKRANLVPAQRLQVTLSKWPSFGIVASRITVHGTVAVPNRPEPSEITESLDLNRILDPRLIGSPGSSTCLATLTRPATSRESSPARYARYHQKRYASLDRLKMVCLGERLQCGQLYRSGIGELCRRHKLARLK